MIMTDAKRPVRVANCSGYKNDPAYRMHEQATLGDVDFITGDYLAEMNIAETAEAYAKGTHPGYEQTAWEGIKQSIDVLAEKKTKVVINGGAQNPAGLAEKVHELITERSLNLKVAYVTGDNILDQMRSNPSSLQKIPPHLDSAIEHLNASRPVPELTSKSIVSANAYVGARGIVQALRNGADIVICGRVSDASPVIGAAWFWHDWDDSDYDRLAGALVAGHLIECSAYATGGNFSGFTDYPIEDFVNPGFPIAEIKGDGSCVITKHPGTGGMVTVDTVRTQLLYELQGNVYLHSDSKAYLDNVSVESEGKDRVFVSGITGRPPPPTTKVAMYYHGGYQAQLLLNATGYGTDEKWKLLEMQVRSILAKSGAEKNISLLDFQIVGRPEQNPSSQLRSTTYCRLFAEAAEEAPLRALQKAFGSIALQHFSGFHFALDTRTFVPRPFLSFYPALYPQSDLQEAAILLGSSSSDTTTIDAGHPPKFEPLEARASYDASNAPSLSSFGPTTPLRLGDIALGRSGDKGSNLNCGIFPKPAYKSLWPWLRAFLSRERIIALLGDDWKDEFFLERVEFEKIQAVHFVVYGILGRGVSGSTRLDCLGKGFADFFRDKVVEVPVGLLEGRHAL
ncbi:DUF1446-domain-containing protein [Aulographum hederae CBS 113979]|uniref:DUF1446-domain-containing protein n=1 Tax=Aulographum hederae CBS 113979 TaxID=1176131 RepID=A0A6G1GV93_9PEZI|nr:DUF1446-domain-containing protein [Aulographum hederae CBS 113979]